MHRRHVRLVLFALAISPAAAWSGETGFDVNRPDAINAYTRCSQVLQHACPADLGARKDGPGQFSAGQTSNENQGTAHPPLSAVMTAERNRKGVKGIYLFRESVTSSAYGQSYFCPLPDQTVNAAAAQACNREGNGKPSGCTVNLQIPVGASESILGSTGLGPEKDGDGNLKSFSSRDFLVNYSPYGVDGRSGSFLFGSGPDERRFLTRTRLENKIDVACVPDGAPPNRVKEAMEADVRARLLGGAKTLIMGQSQYDKDGIVACAKRQIDRAKSPRTMSMVWDDERPPYATPEEWSPVVAAGQDEKKKETALTTFFAQASVQRREQEFQVERFKSALYECSALLYPTPKGGEGRDRYTAEFTECLVPGSGNTCFQQIDKLIEARPTGTGEVPGGTRTGTGSRGR